MNANQAGHIKGTPSDRLPDGLTRIVEHDKNPQVGLTFSVYRTSKSGSILFGDADLETAVLAFSGRGGLSCEGQTLEFRRTNWIDQNPTVIHCCAGSSIEVHNPADDPLEVFVVQTPNRTPFAPRFYSTDQVGEEHRGKGILNDTCYRIVRLVFDDSNGPPESRMVLGEVVNFPGRWSSYPPHHHPQPEIYYYRFEPGQGYGHGELGDQVVKLEDGDLLVITAGNVHAQVSAPGYHMYYLWAIRHLEGNRYSGFQFDPRHLWTLEG